MKNGIDISGNALTAFIIRVGSMLELRSLVKMPTTAPNPSAKASGMPRMAAAKKPSIT